MINYFILDVESTGLRVGWHEINQISVINQKGEQITVDIAISHPERCSPEALNVQGKTINDLRKGITKEDAVNLINEFLCKDGLTPAHRCIVAHNAQFDKKFCHSLWDEVDVKFPADMWLCTKEFAKKYAKKFGAGKIASAQNAKKAKFGLVDFINGVGLPLKYGAHSANVDTQNTSTLLKFLWASGVEYVSLIKRFPHKEVKEELSLEDYE